MNKEDQPDRKVDFSILKKRIFSQILPVKILKAMIFVVWIAFLLPFQILFFVPIEEFVNYPIILATFSALFVLFCTLTLLVLVQFRNPYMQELKDKFGYVE